jgi:hypothetical protein
LADEVAIAKNGIADDESGHQGEAEYHRGAVLPRRGKTYANEDPLALDVDVGDGQLVGERHADEISRKSGQLEGVIWFVGMFGIEGEERREEKRRVGC